MNGRIMIMIFMRKIVFYLNFSFTTKSFVFNMFMCMGCKWYSFWKFWTITFWGSCYFDRTCATIQTVAGANIDFTVLSNVFKRAIADITTFRGCPGFNTASSVQTAWPTKFQTLPQFHLVAIQILIKAVFCPIRISSSRNFSSGTRIWTDTTISVPIIPKVAGGHSLTLFLAPLGSVP